VKRRDLPLSQLRAFEAAARHGSFKLAAQELAVTPAAISQQVRELEGWLGLALFERRTRQVVMLGCARRLYQVLRQGFDDIALEIGALREHEGSPTVTLSCTPAFATQWVMPRLSDFSRRYPGIDLRLHASEVPVNLDQASTLAIRYGRGDYAPYSGFPLGEDAFALVASPRLGVRTLDELRQQRHIVIDWHDPGLGQPDWPQWYRAMGRQWTCEAGLLTFSNESHAIQAAIAGEGVALVGVTLIQGELLRGHLVAPFALRLKGPGYHLVASATSLRDAKVAATGDWVRQGMG